MISRDPLRSPAKQPERHLAELVLKELLSLGAIFGDDRVHADDKMRLGMRRRGFIFRPIKLCRLMERLRREMRGKGIGEAELGGEVRAKERGSKDIDRDFCALSRDGLNELPLFRIIEKRDEIGDILREAFGRAII